MSSGDLTFTVIVCAAIFAFAAVRIVRIYKDNWRGMWWE